MKNNKILIPQVNIYKIIYIYIYIFVNDYIINYYISYLKYFNLRIINIIIIIFISSIGTANNTIPRKSRFIIDSEINTSTTGLNSASASEPTPATANTQNTEIKKGRFSLLEQISTDNRSLSCDVIEGIVKKYVYNIMCIYIYIYQIELLNRIIVIMTTMTKTK